jgi:hypothetical protein
MAATRHFSLRVDSEMLSRLEHESRRTGQSRSQLAKTLLDEGLRMEQHPGIVFRPGPAGRRPALAAGPDVWEVARVLRALTGDRETVLRQASDLTELAVEQLRIALRYYAEFRGEIDDWIERVDEEADLAEAAHRRERELLGS